MGVKGSLGIPAGGPLQHGKPSGRTGPRLATTASNSAAPFEEAGAVRAVDVALASCRKAHGFAVESSRSWGRVARARPLAVPRRVPATAGRDSLAVIGPVDSEPGDLMHI